MKIALYVPSWPPGSTANGIITYAAQTVPALRKLGHEVYVLTSDDRSQNSDEHTIDLARFQSSDSFRSRIERKLFRQTPYDLVAPAIVRAVTELVKTRGIDVFEIEESFGWSYAISRLKLVPVVVRLHGPWFLNGQFDRQNNNMRADREREILEYRGIRSADLVTSPSSTVLNSVRDHYNLTLTNSVVIPNSVKASTQNALWHLNRPTASSLLYIGRFDERKGGDLVIRAFAKLAERDPTARLTFVGPDLGVRNSDGTIAKYHDFVHRNISDNIRSRIDFRGALPHSQLRSLRTSAFTTVVASQYEILPYAVLEAMSHGCPVVATAVGGIPELIQNMQNGLLVPTQDLDAMAKACRLLFDQPELASRLGNQAWQDCRRHYAPEKLALETVEAYQQAKVQFAGLKSQF
jgi:glycosyltransferase involved in cell wall biosynthesis